VQWPITKRAQKGDAQCVSLSDSTMWLAATPRVPAQVPAKLGTTVKARSVAAVMLIWSCPSVCTTFTTLCRDFGTCLLEVRTVFRSAPFHLGRYAWRVASREQLLPCRDRTCTTPLHQLPLTHSPSNGPTSMTRAQACIVKDAR
jgi:hypothetical protein